MSTQAAMNLGFPPGFCFRPEDNELIEHFLLPSVRGEAALFPGVVIMEDDSAANTLPWKLLKRHGLPDDDEAYFFVRTSKEAAARQDRYCDGGATWVSQRTVPGGSCIAGQEIKWTRTNLNLHMGRGKNGGGSTGWVMHEYTITEPPCPFLKICHIAFTGHGKERKRVPDHDEDAECQQAASKRARIEADANDKGSTTDEVVYGAEYLTGDEEIDRCAKAFFYELVAVDKSIQRNRGSTTQTQATVSDQELCVAHATAYQPLPTDQCISSMNQQFVDQELLDLDLDQQLLDLDLDQNLCIEQGSAYQPFPNDQGISSPINQDLLLDGAYNMPTAYQEIQDAAQLQPLQSPSCSFPFAASDGADLYLEQDPTTMEQQQPMEQQSEEDQQERLYWRTTIGFDMDNFIF